MVVVDTMSTTGDMKVDTDIGEMSMAATEEKEEDTATGIITEEDIVEAVTVAVDTVAATQNVTVMKTIIMALNHMVEDTTHTDLTTTTGDVEDTILITVVILTTVPLITVMDTDIPIMV